MPPAVELIGRVADVQLVAIAGSLVECLPGDRNTSLIGALYKLWFILEDRLEHRVIHRPPSSDPLTRISAITPLLIDQSMGSMNVPKICGETWPMLPVVSILTETTDGIGLPCVTCAIRHADARQQRQEAIARRVLSSNTLFREMEVSIEWQ